MKIKGKKVKVYGHAKSGPPHHPIQPGTRFHNKQMKQTEKFWPNKYTW